MKSKFFYGLTAPFLGLSLLLGCNWSSPPVTEDSEAPAVQLQVTAQEKQIQVLALARDNVRVNRVEFYQENELGLEKVLEDTQAPFTLKLNAEETATKQPVVVAVAYDDAGNGGLSNLYDFQSDAARALLSSQLGKNISPKSTPLQTQADSQYQFNVNVVNRKVEVDWKSLNIPVVFLPIKVTTTQKNMDVKVEGYALNLSRTSIKSTRLIFDSFKPDSVTLKFPSGYTADQNAFTELPDMQRLEVKPITWNFNNPAARNFQFQVSVTKTQMSPLKLTSVSPDTFPNHLTKQVLLKGSGFRAETEFFMESTKLKVQNWTPEAVTVEVPDGFLPSTYGIMAINPGGEKDVLYPAFTITEGPTPPAADPKNHPFSFVEGFVTDYTSQKGIAGAQVTVRFTENGKTQLLATTTTQNGYYLLRGLPVGQHLVRIEADGYEPVYRNANIVDNGTDPNKGSTVTLKLAELESQSTLVTEIGPEGGIHYASELGDAGPFLVIPKGAVDHTVPFRFTHTRAANTLPELPSDGYYLAFARLEPVGLTFKKPATLYLPLQPDIKVAVGTPIRISYYEPREGKWVQDITSGVIKEIKGKLFLEYEINHFTWIGGQWYPDPVEGCVQYTDGHPAAAVVTNWGTTDPSGCYFGSTTRSDVGRTLHAYVQGARGTFSGAVSASYDGSGPVKFPTIILPSPLLPVIVPPSLNNPCQGGSFPYLVQKNATEGSGAPQLIMGNSFVGFQGMLASALESDWDFSTVRVTLNQKDISAKVSFHFQNTEDLEIKYQPEEPLQAGLGQVLNIRGRSKNGAEASNTITLDVAHSFSTPQILYRRMPRTYTGSPVVTDMGPYVVVSIPENHTGDVQVPLPIYLLDQHHQLLKSNAESGWTVSYQGRTAPVGKFTEGKAVAQVTVRFSKGTTTPDNIKLLQNAPNATGILKQGGSPCPPLFPVPDYEIPVSGNPAAKVDKLGLELAGKWGKEAIASAATPTGLDSPYIQDNNPEWNNYIKGNQGWAPLVNNKWIKVLQGTPRESIFRLDPSTGEYEEAMVPVLNTGENAMFGSPKNEIPDFTSQQGTFDFVMSSANLPFVDGKDSSGSTLTGYIMLNGPKYGIHVQGMYTSDPKGDGTYHVTVSAKYTFGDTTDLNPDKDPADNVIGIASMVLLADPAYSYETSISWPADAQFDYDPKATTPEDAFKNAVGWPFALQGSP